MIEIYKKLQNYFNETFNICIFIKYYINLAIKIKKKKLSKNHIYYNQETYITH